MATLNTTKRAPQYANNYNTLRKKINDTLNDFDVLSPKRKVTRHIFKWGWSYFLIFCLLYFITSAFFNMHLCQLYGPKFPSTCGKTGYEPSFLQQLVNLITGHTRLVTVSVEIVLLVIGAILLLSLFKNWQWYAPKTLRDLFNNKRIDAVRVDDNCKHDNMTIATRYLFFIDRYKNDLRIFTSYLFGFCGIIYTIYSIICLIIKAYNQQQWLLHNLTPPDAVLLSLLILSLMFFAIIEVILFYSVGTILFIVIISGKYLGELMRDFHITSNPIHLDRCGGLKQLGKFCQWLILPILTFSLFFLGYEVVTVILTHFPRRGEPLGGNTATLDLINFLIILALCVLASSLVIRAAGVPLWKIHVEMIDENEIAQQKQSTEITRLEKRLQALIDQDQLEQAKITGEKLALEKTLNTSYPNWPFILIKTSVTSIITLIISGSLSPVLTWLLSGRR